MFRLGRQSTKERLQRIARRWIALSLMMPSLRSGTPVAVGRRECFLVNELHVHNPSYTVLEVYLR